MMILNIKLLRLKEGIIKEDIKQIVTISEFIALITSFQSYIIC
jgi:hypothetical protein